MLRKLLALGLVGATLLGTLSGGVMAAEPVTYEEDPTYYQQTHLDEVTELFEDEVQLESSLLEGSGVDTYSKAFPRQVAGETIRPGIDISEHQKKIDWAKVADAGVEFAIIRVGYRGYSTGALIDDSNYVYNIREAKANGIKVGVYVFSQAITPEEGAEEARFLLNRIQGFDIDLPLVLDYEFVATGVGRLYEADLSRQEGTDVCNAFCAEVERRGYASMVYANPSMLSGRLYRNQMGRLWLAHYTPRTNYTGDYEYWQFSSNGVIAGISGNVDLNFWFDKGLPFEDVKQNQWFFDGISWAYQNNIINGLSKTEFAPTQTAQRAQVITMIHRLMGRPAATGEVPYTDIGPYDWAKDAIRWGTGEGVVNGSSATTFSPANSAERQMLVTMLYRLSQKPESTQDLGTYQDVGQVQSWAKDAMAWAVEQEIIKGYDEDGVWTLKPDRACTRAEVATILKRYQEYQEKVAQEEEEKKKQEEEEKKKQEEEEKKKQEEANQPTQPESGSGSGQEAGGTGGNQSATPA